MAVPERVNYALRPNKNVERKLVVEALRGLMPEFQISDHRYIGMGSLWFVDFALVHRILGINDMVSIERYLPDRAAFNRPFRCIKVRSGDTSVVLPQLDLEARPSIVWLDHESGVGGAGLSDAITVVESVPSGSVLILTLNSEANGLKRQRDPDGHELSKEEALRRYAGDAVPPQLDGDALDRDKYPQLLGRIIVASIRHALRASGRSERFHQLFDFTYEDDARMVTLGGMIASETDAAKIPWDRLEKLQGITREGQEQRVIDVPLLTPKEKISLDRLLPGLKAISARDVRKKYNFSLPREKLEAYCLYYRQYPLFGEFLS